MADERSLKKPVPGITRPPKEQASVPTVKSPNPMFSEHMGKLLNFRIEQEEQSSRLYLAMSLWLTNMGYLGAGALWKIYSDEEMIHADWARDYILSFGVQPLTPKLEMPLQSFSGLPDIIKRSYDHEVLVTSQLKTLASEAMKEGDFMVHELALHYLKEQVEEHDKLQNWMDRLDAFGTDATALRFLDNEMAEKAEG